LEHDERTDKTVSLRFDEVQQLRRESTPSAGRKAKQDHSTGLECVCVDKLPEISILRKKNALLADGSLDDLIVRHAGESSAIAATS
jgi:hypothetical protein